MSFVPRSYPEVVREDPPPRTRTARGTAARGAHRVLVVLAVVGSLHALFLLGVEGWRFVQEQRAIHLLQRQVSGLQAESGGLKQVIDHADDQTYREDLARRQGYMFPDELRAVTQQPAASAPGGQTTP